MSLHFLRVPKTGGTAIAAALVPRAVAFGHFATPSTLGRALSDPVAATRAEVERAMGPSPSPPYRCGTGSEGGITSPPGGTTSWARYARNGSTRISPNFTRALYICGFPWFLIQCAPMGLGS